MDSSGIDSATSDGTGINDGCALRKAAFSRNLKLYAKSGDLAKNSKKMETFIRRRVMSGRLPTSKSLQVYTSDDEDVSDSDDDTDDNDDEKQNYDLSYSVVHTMLSYQFHIIRRIWRYTLQTAAKSGKSIIYKSIPKTQLVTFISFMAYDYVISTGFLINFIPFAILCYSLSTMVTSTLQAVHGERHFQKFIAWSDSLRSVDTLINTKEAEENYILKHQPPIRRFLLGLLGTLMAYPFCYAFVPSSYLAIISFALFGISLWSFSGVVGISSVVSMTLIVAVFLVRINNFTAFSSVSLIVFGFLRVSLGFDALLRILQIATFFAIPFTSKKEELASKKVAIKRDYTRQAFLSLWLELSILFVKSSSNMWELATAFTYLTMTIFLFPVACTWFTYYWLRWLLTIVDMHVFAFVLIVIVLAIVFIYFKPQFHRLVSFIQKRVIEHKLLLVAVFAIVTLLSASNQQSSSGHATTHVESLPISDYTRLCMHDFSDVTDQLRCRRLTGLYGNWKGVVVKTEVTSIENKARDFVSQLPSSIADPLKCIIGDPYQTKQDGLDLSYGRKCNLDRYNIYNFILSVKSEANYILPIKANDEFKEPIVTSHPGDEIEFQVVVADNGTALDLLAITSLKGQAISVASDKKALKPLLAVECAFDFIFSPVFNIQYGVAENKECT